jgi:hypothetical protein
MGYYLGDGIYLSCVTFVKTIHKSQCNKKKYIKARATWRAATSIMARVGQLVQRTGDGRIGRILSGRTIERSGGAVCDLHRARRDEGRGFLNWVLKPSSTVCYWFGFKITRTIFSSLASKPMATVSLVWPQNRWLRFLCWDSKPRWWMVFQFDPQNQ